MTLGNDPQPLTRRQMRERARALAPESVLDAETEVEKSAAPESPSVSPDEADAGVTASAFAPRGAADQPLGDEPADDDDDDAAVAHRSELTTERASVPERTLTRRELRELMAARQAENGVVPDADVVPDGFVIDEDVEDDDIPEDVVDDDDAIAGNEERAAGTSYEMPSAPALSLPPQAINTPLNPPVGHWSIDRDVDEHTQVLDQSQPFDQLLSRGVAAGGIPTTTNALILPSIPQQGNSSGSLTSTGEILITGSIDLPRSLGSTGQHPNHFDSSEMDHLEDQLDEAGPTTSVAPVSASRAVSTHTSTRGVMTPPKKRAASLPVILAVTAGVLLVGVLALFAAAYLFQIF
ncbi:MAG: hypothetical protein JWM23_6 [Microbacteriaceae bacterium]|jgi:hypothetical protein|nr:hypothetical protein [Microbacteriaceae bacterium]